MLVGLGLQLGRFLGIKADAPLCRVASQPPLGYPAAATRVPQLRRTLLGVIAGGVDDICIA